MSSFPSLEELEGGRTVELKVYEVKKGGWPHFLSRWRKIVKLRRAAGFKVEFAVADIPGNRFVWAVSLDSDFTSQNLDYLNSPDRIAANTISDYVAAFEIPHVITIPVD
ncbi:NIPSNAP family containing protein [Sphingobium sp. SCG-1]|uniref:NIPSNAP family containing protein n=1 Tax=Sphingobium sp. SCG-1 TaxID=2072936 RepID=UPI000CD69727|nr:NIPSNAP family containing protein [Sphingobium sp. SCG-1]AUW58988.1 NIPSNAP family containing protein [Sphingobium sp. SCG-1]